MPEDYTFWRPAGAPDPTQGPPLDLGGFAGALLGGYSAGQSIRGKFTDDRAAEKAKKVTGYDPRDRGMERVRPRSETEPGPIATVIGGLASGLLQGRAIAKEQSDPLGALKRKLNEQTVQMNDIEIGEALVRRDEAIAGRAAAAEFNIIVNNAIRRGLANDPVTQNNILGWLAEHPEAAQLPAVKNQLQLFGQSRTILQERQKRMEAIKGLNDALDSGMLRDQMDVTIGDTRTRLRQPDDIGQQFAPPMIERKLKLYEEALRTGNQTAIKAYEQDLGLNALSPADRARYDAEIAGLERNTAASSNSDEYLRQRLKIAARYFGRPAGPSVSPPPPLGSTNSSGNVFRYDSSKQGKDRLVPK